MTKYVKWLSEVISNINYCLNGDWLTLKRTINDDKLYKENRNRKINIIKRNKILKENIFNLENNGFLISETLDEEINNKIDMIKNISILDRLNWSDWLMKESEALQQIDNTLDWLVDIIKRINDLQKINEDAKEYLNWNNVLK